MASWALSLALVLAVLFSLSVHLQAQQFDGYYSVQKSPSKSVPYTATQYKTLMYCCQDKPSVNTREGHIKLIDGPSLNEGRLMINYKNFYGAICADRFDTHDATTACHQLGFAGVETITGCCPYGTRPYGEIWIDELQCTSDQVWLPDCRRNAWGDEDCHNGQEIGIRCNPVLNLRLTGGRHSFEGRVEQYHAGRWGTVCDDTWDMKDARVACNQLGLGEPAKAITGTSRYFSLRKGSPILSRIDCVGTEIALGGCYHTGWRANTCPASSDNAGVVCKGPVPQDFKMDNVSESSASFSFTLPTQLQFTTAVKEYKVEFHPLPNVLGDKRVLFVTPSNSRSVKPRFTIQGLNPCSTYTFKVAVVASKLDGGTGPYSQPINVATQTQVPGDMRGLNGMPFNSSCASFKLEPPASTDDSCSADIQSYLIVFIPHPRFASPIPRTVSIPAPLPTGNKVTVCGLKYYVPYIFHASAVNRAGSGPQIRHDYYHYELSNRFN
uniref:Deleted in malignant brain tumors 1 protein-like protein 3 n=1 Tax=Halisarca dujardinii TaxID=2583056 RepID=A0AA96MNV3_HALDU|nr:deleted in malignant brain tumors 1 protein-like protein 3 [Halisarca dujardinii]